jgi:formate hydrogenlyase subunit 4
LFFVLTAPFLTGLIKWLKCQLQNRQGPSLFQPYKNLNKLFRKQVILPNTTSYIFRVTPYVVFVTTLVAASLIPIIAVHESAFAIGDVIVLVGLFAVARFFLALSGMDAGTTFGGMGSSREMMIAAIVEPALLIAFFTLAMVSNSTDINVIVTEINNHHIFFRPSLIFAALGFAIVAIAETGRIPVDNPATHLELTMIHEAMILEYSGRYLALIEWASQIKLMIYAVLLINLFFPWGIATDFTFSALYCSFAAFVFKLIILCIILTVAETNLAKLRLFRAPYLLNIAFLLCLLGVLNHVILET